MPILHVGRKTEPTTNLRPSEDLIAVRTRSQQPLARSAGPVPVPMSEDLGDGTLVAEYPEAGVQIFRVPVGAGQRTLGERKTALRALPDVRFAGGVLVDPVSHEPVLCTENLFVKFVDSADRAACLEALRAAALNTGPAPIKLQDRAGGSGQALRRVYDAAGVPGLAALAGRDCHGRWALTVRDAAKPRATRKTAGAASTPRKNGDGGRRAAAGRKLSAA
jgi:hypothetical protein